MLRTSFTFAEKFLSLVINLSHLRCVLRGSVLGPWRLREDEHNKRFPPFEPQIRRQGTAAESETTAVVAVAAVRRLIKGSRWSVKCVCERGRGAEEWGGLSLAVTWNSCFSAVRWRWILAHFLPVPPPYLCCQFTVFRGPESHSFPGERRKINAIATINHLCWRIVAHKRSQSCKCLLLLSFFFFFFSGWETLARASALLRKNCSSRVTLWQRGRCSDTAGLTLSRNPVSQSYCIWDFIAWGDCPTPCLQLSSRSCVRGGEEDGRRGETSGLTYALFELQSS